VEMVGRSLVRGGGGLQQQRLQRNVVVGDDHDCKVWLWLMVICGV